MNRAASHTWRDRLIALALGIATCVWMLAVESRQGIGRDEAQYMRAGERYWAWFGDLATNVAHGRPGASFTDAAIDRSWGDNAPDHPVVMKILFGASWRLFHGRENPEGRGLHPVPPTSERGVFPVFKHPSTAFRFPAILMSGLLASLVYAFARRFVGPAAAVVASVLTIAQPHLFFHGQIACFDGPITTMAVAVGLAYWKSLRSPRWGWLVGVIYGIALGVKHNAWLMPIFLVGHYLWMRRGDLRRGRLPPVPLAFLSMAVIGPLVFLAHWPWLWPNPPQRVRTYVLRHVEHEHYNFEYLGRNWNLPPQEWDRKLVRATFPFVSTALTIPVTTLALAAAGGVVLARRRRRRDEGGGDQADSQVGLAREGDAGWVQTGSLLPSFAAESGAPRGSWLRPGADVDLAPGAFMVVQILGPMAILALPSAPIFGGVKHFMPAFPYLAICAGIGTAWATRAIANALRARRVRTVDGAASAPAAEQVDGSPVARPTAGPSWLHALPVGVAALVCLPAVAETQRSHPDGLSHYNLLAGGFAGGASLGMNRQFWGYAVKPMLPFIAQHAPLPTPIYWHDVLGDALNIYVRDGVMPVLGNAGGGEDGIRRSQLSLIVHERHMTLYEGVIWESYGTTQPAYVRTREGVPLVTAYVRPPAVRTPSP